MEESLLKEIYMSDCGPIDKIKNTEEYDRLSDEAEKYYGKLIKVLGKEQKTWLDDLLDLETLIAAEMGFMCFRAGIKFGIQFITEAFRKENEKK